ncbi:MAG TPA: hypothetical protein VIS06_20730, partial [Mycobacteriales bacterium]
TAFGSASMNVTIRVDGTDTSTSVALDTPTLTAGTVWTVELFCGQRVESIQVAPGIRPTVDWNNGWAPTAFLEPGLNELVAVPSTEAADGWQLLQDIVGAEFGTLRFDGSGRAVFWNRRHWRESTVANTVQRTLTATESILGLTTVELSGQVRNTIRVKAQPLTVKPAGLVWQANDVYTVPPFGVLPVWADAGSDQFYQVDTAAEVIPSGGTAVHGHSGYRASRAPDGSGGEVTNLTMLIEPFASTIKITFSNPNPFPVYLVSPKGTTYPDSSDGKASVALVGRLITSKITPVDTGTVDPVLDSTPTAEATVPGVVAAQRLYTAPDSPWRQRLSDAQSLADDLLLALHRPVPQIQDLSILADPSLELGDRVWLEDPDGTKLNDPLWVVGLRTSFDASGMTQSVTLRPVAAPGQFIFGVAGRNLLGVTPL